MSVGELAMTPAMFGINPKPFCKPSSAILESSGTVERVCTVYFVMVYSSFEIQNRTAFICGHILMVNACRYSSNYVRGNHSAKLPAK